MIDIFADDNFLYRLRVFEKFHELVYLNYFYIRLDVVVIVTAENILQIIFRSADSPSEDMNPSSLLSIVQSFFLCQRYQTNI